MTFSELKITLKRAQELEHSLLSKGLLFLLPLIIVFAIITTRTNVVEIILSEISSYTDFLRLHLNIGSFAAQYILLSTSIFVYFLSLGTYLAHRNNKLLSKTYQRTELHKCITSELKTHGITPVDTRKIKPLEQNPLELLFTSKGKQGLVIGPVAYHQRSQDVTFFSILTKTRHLSHSSNHLESEEIKITRSAHTLVRAKLDIEKNLFLSFRTHDHALHPSNISHIRPANGHEYARNNVIPISKKHQDIFEIKTNLPHRLKHLFCKENLCKLSPFAEDELMHKHYFIINEGYLYFVASAFLPILDTADIATQELDIASRVDDPSDQIDIDSVETLIIDTISYTKSLISILQK